MISLRPSLITEHHSESSLNDPAREASPCSRYLRPARDVDTTCTVGRNVHESMATKVKTASSPELTSRMRRSIRPTRPPCARSTVSVGRVVMDQPAHRTLLDETSIKALFMGRSCEG